MGCSLWSSTDCAGELTVQNYPDVGYRILVSPGRLVFPSPSNTSQRHFKKGNILDCCVEALLANGATVDAANAMGMTALSEAIQRRSFISFEVSLLVGTILQLETGLLFF